MLNAEARAMAKSIVGTCIGAVGIAAGMAAPLAAQTLWLPGSDPVNIGRSGTGVAFGQSLEAAALNPALLSSIRDHVSVYLAGGVELQSSQVGSSSTGNTLFTTDRNRSLPTFGAAWRLNDTFALGVKLDNPFMRHSILPQESTVRFECSALALTVRRLEFQGSLAVSPAFSIGLGIGMARVNFDSASSLRIPLPADPTHALSAANPSQGLMELPLCQSGNATVATYSAGFRWAINSRWTLAGAYQGSIKATPSLDARIDSFKPVYHDNDGFSTPNLGTAALGPALVGSSRLQAGSGSVVLPARASLGIRQRVNQVLTWEADMHYIQGSGFELPTQASLVTPTGTASAPLSRHKGRSGYGLSAMMEMTLGKRWTARMGGELMPALIEDAYAEPLVGGAPTAGFSGGVSYKALKGEFSLGYQYRQAKDRFSSELDGSWDLYNGYRKTGTSVRVEGAGHLISLGYKKVF